MRSSATAELPPLWPAAESSAGFTGAGPAPSFCVRLSTNGRYIQSPTRNGRASTTNNSEPKESAATLRSARWLLNGFAYCSAVGWIASLTMRSRINRRLLVVDSTRQQRKRLCNFSGKLLLVLAKSLLPVLDRTAQMSILHPVTGSVSNFAVATTFKRIISPLDSQRPHR